MGSYTSPDISGYNSNPPSDDGAETTSNRIDWDTIKTKLDDPVKTYAEAIDSATDSAFTTVDADIAAMTNGIFSNNANGNPTIEDTVFDVVNTVNSFDAYESVGPTGAGATHTWTALDSVPAGVDWVEVSVNLHLFIAGTSPEMRILARATGSTSTAAGPQTIAFFGFGDDTSNTKVFDAFSIAKIQVDSSGLFDIFYTGDGNTPSSHAYMYVTGYGYN